MNCSSRCFHDPIVRRQVDDLGRNGRCDLTGKRNVKVVNATELRALFTPLLKFYEPFRGSAWEHLDILAGNTLFDCIQTQDGWEIFNANLDSAAGCEFLDAVRGITNGDGAIRSDEEWVYKRQFYEEMNKGWWHEFSKQLKHRRRFIPDVRNKSVGDPRKLLSEHLGTFEYTLTAGKTLYRARIGVDDNAEPKVCRPIPIGKMGAPPASKATDGRTNPAGVSYLYLAEQEATAVQEVRAFVGAKVTIAKLTAIRDLKLVNVAKVKHVFSPFLYPDLGRFLAAREILIVLNEQLASPVSPHTSHLDYLPSQYLAEVVVDNGFDGIRYKSAMAKDGVNVVLFDEGNVVGSETKLVEVMAMTVSYGALTKYARRHPRTNKRKILRTADRVLR